ncbi:MAG: YceI family protein [Pseudomonadales bacterium]|nr:YceI family protein [Pseudomonadales bacterium]
MIQTKLLLVMRLLIVLTTVTATPNLLAHWTLNNDFSQLSFVTVKAGSVGEVHKFKSLTGTLTDKGALSVNIQLASVDTLIPIRDERMQEFLFETSLFPTATFTASLDMEGINQLQVGASSVLEVTGVLAIKETELPLTIQVVATQFESRRVLVNSLQPIIVNADAFGLSQGVEKLRELAGLPSISPAVPISFFLTFNG